MPEADRRPGLLLGGLGGTVMGHVIAAGKTISGYRLARLAQLREYDYYRAPAAKL